MSLTLDASDELFHPRNEDPYWNESAWFGLTLPERDDCLGYDRDRTQALPPGAEMFDFTLENGLSVEMLEPFASFRIRHRGAFDADLRWERLTEPYAFGINARAVGARRAELMWCAASASNAFSVYSVSGHEDEDDPVVGTTARVAFGHYIRDGEGAYVTGGTSRVLERGADGRPLRVVLDAEDELGRQLHAAAD